MLAPAAVRSSFRAARIVFAEDRPTPIDLAQAGIAAALGDAGQAIDALRRSVQEIEEAEFEEVVEATPAEGKNAA
jgi:hypothetical protein